MNKITLKELETNGMLALMPNTYLELTPDVWHDLEEARKYCLAHKIGLKHKLRDKGLLSVDTGLSDPDSNIHYMRPMDIGLIANAVEETLKNIRGQYTVVLGNRFNPDEAVLQTNLDNGLFARNSATSYLAGNPMHWVDILLIAEKADICSGLVKEMRKYITTHDTFYMKDTELRGTKAWKIPSSSDLPPNLLDMVKDGYGTLAAAILAKVEGVDTSDACIATTRQPNGYLVTKIMLISDLNAETFSVCGYCNRIEMPMALAMSAGLA